MLKLNNYEKVGINSEVSSFYVRFFKLIDGSKYRQKFSNQQKTEEIIIYVSMLMLKIIWQL